MINFKHLTAVFLGFLSPIGSSFAQDSTTVEFDSKSCSSLYEHDVSNLKVAQLLALDYDDVLSEFHGADKEEYKFSGCGGLI